MNNPYRGGTPDYFYELHRQLWVEYKFIEVPKRAGTIIHPNLSALQLTWLKRNHANGHGPLVVVGSRQGGIVLRDPRNWTDGFSAGAFVRSVLTKQVIASQILKAVSP
jgi:hypothetical protein